MIDAPLIKQPSESRLYTIPFAALLAEGETIIAIIDFSVMPNSLTVSGVSTHPNGHDVVVRLADGAADVLYHGAAKVLTSDDNILEVDVYLKVKEL